MKIEEAVRHAVEAEVARLPEHMKGLYPVDAIVNAAVRGEQHPALTNLKSLMEMGSPEFVPENDDDRELQDALLKDYRGSVWLPDEVKQLGREPESYEMSRGGRMAQQIRERKRLLEELERAHQTKAAPRSAGYQSPMGYVPNFTRQHTDDEAKQSVYDLAARNYSNAMEATHDTVLRDLGRQVSNPENFLGSFVTKMGPVISDGASLVASALLSGQDATEAPGNAAARAYGADWNRTYPQLTGDHGWRQNDKLVQDMRGAYRNSEGMSSGDTFRSVFGGHVPGIQPLFNGAMSFANGLLDGSTLAGSLASAPVKTAAIATSKAAVPVLSPYAARVAKDIAGAGWKARTAAEVGSEAFDITNLANTAAQFADPDPNETQDEFKQRQAYNAQVRDQATRQLDAGFGAIKRPESTYQKYLAEPVGRAIGKTVGGLMQ